MELVYDVSFYSCKEDFIEVYFIKPQNETRVGVYCGFFNPGPIVSEAGIHRMKIIFKSNHVDVSSGFSARYTFIEMEPLIGMVAT